MSEENRVRQASQQFYAALNSMANGNAVPMSEIWSHAGDVTTMHPIGGFERGWENVEGPWQQVAQMSASGRVQLDDQFLLISGDLACEVGREQGSIALAGDQITIDQRVTNVYRREADGWKIVHHHVDMSPAMVKVLARLQSGQ